jgi:hypothetical protein
MNDVPITALRRFMNALYDFEESELLDSPFYTYENEDNKDSEPFYPHRPASISLRQ